MQRQVVPVVLCTYRCRALVRRHCYCTSDKWIHKPTAPPVTDHSIYAAYPRTHCWTATGDGQLDREAPLRGRMVFDSSGERCRWPRGTRKANHGHFVLIYPSLYSISAIRMVGRLGGWLLRCASFGVRCRHDGIFFLHTSAPSSRCSGVCGNQ